MEKHLFTLPLLLVFSLLTACGSGSKSPTDSDDFFVPSDLGNVTGDPFDPERLMIVQISMPKSEFQTLSSQGRTLDTGLSSCPSHDFEYDTFNAKVNIDGTVLNDVVIRKKGYLGSLSPTKPSLKLDFDESVEGRLFKGLKRMTLNNNRQDPTHARQCLAYSLYAQAGIKVPRCSLAKVYVNGEEMGVYTHVESIKKPFLERVFNNKEGNLYEAQLSDFGQQLNSTFELKTNKTGNDRSDLSAVANALALSNDGEFLTAIEGVVALDEFITYWAMDSITGNWDSATGNANNYYVYHHPDDGLFHYIPWGLDAAFTGSNILKPSSGPLYRSNRLAKRLFSIDSTRAQYYDRISQLLTDIWNPSNLIQEINTVQQLTDAPQDAVNVLKTFISGDSSNNISSQAQTLQQAINDDGADQIDYTLADTAPNCDTINTTNLTANFEADDSADKGTFHFKLENNTQITANIYWVSLDASNTDSITSRTDTTTLPNTKAITLIGVDQASVFDGDNPPDVYVLQVSVETPSYGTQPVSLHGFANSLMLFKFISEGNLELIASGRSGSISFSSAGEGTNSSPIKGSILASMGYFQP
ncbi:MAG: CotH kinase family protein [Bermanella sp.]